ncbi:hypothetical protein PCASD_25101 [Puccinia coronata f. sp. avenae]|uniref:Integrase catalytic domain-containing protein n=1 Tax=Puccinia coronata f. sp. avenae TaxID=200324 RepID=A0A2N5TQU4_9BASI|nr:hypothetical protein PCASD_25101 [Puccinia coronata f. sp. avenae]
MTSPSLSSKSEPKPQATSSSKQPVPTMSSKADPETWTHPALKTTTIERLKPPGPGSNYNEWTWFMRAHLNTTDVMYVINDEVKKARANPNWSRDNKAAFGAISSTIHAANVRKVRHITSDARALWEALKEAHQDSSAEGITYFLCKLTTARMTGDDLLAHLEDMAKTFESLSSLITANAPLTLDDIYSSSILTSLPSDWLACVLAMMNDPRVPPVKILDALKAEHLRRKTRNKEQTMVESVARASLSNQSQPRGSRTPLDHSLYCSFCKRPQAKAGHTTVVDLGGGDDQEDSDYSGSNDDTPDTHHARAGNAFAVTEHSANAVSATPRDANLNSGCSNCMTPYSLGVFNVKPDSTLVRLANHSTVEASHRGTALLPLSTPVTVPTLVVPDLHKPLLSIAAMCDSGLTCVFEKERCNIFKTNSLVVDGNPVGHGYCKGGLYYLPSNEVKSLSTSTQSLSSVDSSLLGFHRRLSHIGLRPLKRLLKILDIKPTIMNETDVQRCTVCVQSKMHQSPFKSRSNYRSDSPGKLIHSDVGSFEVVSREGYKYFVTFVDDFSKHVSLFPMKSKSNVFNCFKIFRAHFERDGSYKILSLRSDNGGEYMLTEFSSYLSLAGINHDPGPPHSPELNGFKAPNEILGKPLVNLSTLHPFGCLVWYKVPKANRQKLDAKGRPSLLLSYLGDGNGYRLWDLEKKSVIKSRDVLFVDETFPYGSELTCQPPPVEVELPWPPHLLVSPPAIEKPPQPDPKPVSSILDLPPLDIPLQPQFDRRLTASIHANGKQPVSPTPPSPPSIPAPPPSPSSPKSPTPTPPPSPASPKSPTPAPSPSPNSPASPPPLPPSPSPLPSKSLSPRPQSPPT